MSSSRRSNARQGPPTRRERREEQRRAARKAAQRQSRGLPLVWLTGGVVVVVAAVIVALVLLNQSSSPTSVATPKNLTPTGDTNGRTVGSSSASVTLDLWADFQCPVCKQFTDTVEPNIVSNYISTGKVRLVFHDFAFIGTESTHAAVGGLCAADAGEFWPYHDYVYANQGAENTGALSDAKLKAIAQAVGIDASTFSTCLGSSDKLQTVQDEATQAQSQGITGTPTLYVNGAKVSNPLDYATVSAVIEGALQSASAAPSASPAS